MNGILKLVSLTDEIVLRCKMSSVNCFGISDCTYSLSNITMPLFSSSAPIIGCYNTFFHFNDLVYLDCLDEDFEFITIIFIGNLR